jgi:hypothetical protein
MLVHLLAPFCCIEAGISGVFRPRTAGTAKKRNGIESFLNPSGTTNDPIALFEVCVLGTPAKSGTLSSAVDHCPWYFHRFSPQLRLDRNCFVPKQFGSALVVQTDGV